MKFNHDAAVRMDKLIVILGFEVGCPREPFKEMVGRYSCEMSSSLALTTS